MDGTFNKGDLRSCFSKKVGIGKMLSSLDKKYDALFTERHKVLHEIGGHYQIPRVLDGYWELLKAMFSNNDRSVPQFKDLVLQRI